MAQYIADTNFFPRPRGRGKNGEHRESNAGSVTAAVAHAGSHAARAATRPHAGAHALARSHAASAGRRFIRQGHALFLGADVHPLVMFRADLLALLLGLGSGRAVGVLI